MSEMFTAEQVRERLRAACDKAGSMGAWSRANGVTKAYVSEVLRGAVNPSRAVLVPLGLKRVVYFAVDEAKNVA